MKIRGYLFLIAICLVNVFCQSVVFACPNCTNEKGFKNCGKKYLTRDQIDIMEDGSIFVKIEEAAEVIIQTSALYWDKEGIYFQDYKAESKMHCVPVLEIECRNCKTCNPVWGGSKCYVCGKQI